MNNICTIPKGFGEMSRGEQKDGAGKTDAPFQGPSLFIRG